MLPFLSGPSIELGTVFVLLRDGLRLGRQASSVADDRLSASREGQRCEHQPQGDGRPGPSHTH